MITISTFYAQNQVYNPILGNIVEPMAFRFTITNISNNPFTINKVKLVGCYRFLPFFMSKVYNTLDINNYSVPVNGTYSFEIPIPDGKFRKYRLKVNNSFLSETIIV